MFNGKVRILDEVRHVPTLKRNLISLSILDSQGYKYTSEREVIKLTKVSEFCSRDSKGLNYILAKLCKIYKDHVGYFGEYSIWYNNVGVWFGVRVEEYISIEFKGYEECRFVTINRGVIVFGC